MVIVAGFTYCKFSGKCGFFKKEEKNKLVATSNYGEVYDSDVKEYLTNLEKIFSRKIDFNKINKEEKKMLVNEIINQRKILNDAKDVNIDNSEEFKLRLESLKNDLKKEFYLRDLIAKNVTDDAVKIKYEELKKNLSDKNEYKVRHILVKTEEEIKKVKQELKNKKFEEVAKEYSIDGTAQSGGDLGYITDGQTVREFEEKCKEVKLNKVSDPFKTEFGWHVLMKEDQRKVNIPDFNTIKDSLKSELINEFIKKYSEDNIKEANIQFIE